MMEGVEWVAQVTDRKYQSEIRIQQVHSNAVLPLTTLQNDSESLLTVASRGLGLGVGLVQPPEGWDFYFGIEDQARGKGVLGNREGSLSAVRRALDTCRADKVIE